MQETCLVTVETLELCKNNWKIWSKPFSHFIIQFLFWKPNHRRSSGFRWRNAPPLRDSTSCRHKGSSLCNSLRSLFLSDREIFIKIGSFPVFWQRSDNQFGQKISFWKSPLEKILDPPLVQYTSTGTKNIANRQLVRRSLAELQIVKYGKSDFGNGYLISVVSVPFYSNNVWFRKKNNQNWIEF